MPWAEALPASRQLTTFWYAISLWVYELLPIRRQYGYLGRPPVLVASGTALAVGDAAFPCVTGANLQKQAKPQDCVKITVFDSHGLGSGGSGAAAGLLHPFTPKGAIAWNGNEGLAATLRLVAAVSAASEDPEGVASDAKKCPCPGTASARTFDAQLTTAPPLLRHCGILRLGAHAQQTWELVTNLRNAKDSGVDTCGGRPVTAEAARKLAPGLASKRLEEARTWKVPRGREGASVRALRKLGASQVLALRIVPWAFSLRGSQALAGALRSVCLA
jgi:hypothetical protein